MGNGHGLSRDVGLFPGFLIFFFCVEKEDDSTQKSWDQTFRVANIKIPVQCMVSITALNQAALENGNGLRGCESC